MTSGSAFLLSADHLISQLQQICLPTSSTGGFSSTRPTTSKVFTTSFASASPTTELSDDSPLLEKQLETAAAYQSSAAAGIVKLQNQVSQLVQDLQRVRHYADKSKLHAEFLETHPVVREPFLSCGDSTIEKAA
ncbi:unnamed protein product [Amoebophrya sp. A120]|nr:unnamed protein product [Amoebophrya sp. A120]|eukprot:GSA120T00020906001.1